MLEEDIESLYLNETRASPETDADADADTNANAGRTQRVAELSFSCLLLVLGLAIEIVGMIPHKRPFPVKMLQDGEYLVDQTKNEALTGQTVPGVYLVLFAVVIPFCIQLWLSIKAGNGHVHKTLCVYFCAIGITILLTDFIKLYVGYLRPNFLQGCEPDDNYEYCTSDREREMRLSFPSGHSSLSFCGLGILSYYLEMRYGISGSRVLVFHKPSGEMLMGYSQPIGYRRIIAVLSYFPMVIAGFIASSRVVDNFHFPADVVGGALLGASIAWLSHSTWNPSWPTLHNDERTS
eukprot:scaffold1868_cov193-Cylindrotheca_fusiformis.AAC.21